MSYVLDTDVVSALRVRGRHPSVEEWASALPVSSLFVAAPTVAEIERGVVAKERTDPQQGRILRRWFEDRVLAAFSERVLPFDLSAARMLATYRLPEHAPLDDALIAAIAQSTERVVATRNLKHFEPFGVRCVDPWDRASWEGADPGAPHVEAPMPSSPR